MLSQLTFNTHPNKIIIKTDLSQWHSIAFFLRKMISAKIQYKTHNGKFVAIIKAFKTWRYHLEGCKHKVFVLKNHNNILYLHGYKEAELQTSLLGSEAFPIPFSNWLLPRQSKYSYRCFVKVFTKKPRWEK